MGTSIKCWGKDHKFEMNGISVTQIVIHQEDIIIISNTTLLIEGNKVMDKLNKKMLDCEPGKGECTFDSIRYVWRNDKPTCDLLETKKVTGELIQLNGFQMWISDSCLWTKCVANRFQRSLFIKLE